MKDQVPGKGGGSMQPQTIDRLFILIVSGAQSATFMKKLTEEKFYFTVIDSRGGIIEDQTLCLMLGINEERASRLMELVRENCQPYRQFIPAQMNIPGEIAGIAMVEAQLGGAMVYTANVSFFEQI
jgi:uncharacterized protein YaaQ